ncbi:MAG: riboflavin biosynthesis protein RibF [Endomicrobium sp.]|jgi:riboflavin kinase/FMN adenylyltransferase|nr:riboflavin biosynthesis protein RibF [Endomicrobium sp.]
MKKSVIAIGTFDGVHKGHRLIINRVLSVARENNLKSIVIMLQNPIKKVTGLLTTYEEKFNEIKTFGVDEIFTIDAASHVLSCAPEEFFDCFLCKILKVSEIVCGPDFAFGKNREGDIKWINKKVKETNVMIHIERPLVIGSKRISSSYIRMLIEKGDLKNASKLLGRDYSFTGIPSKGFGVGRKLGFPTINLSIDSDKLLPKGVYISLISQNEKIYPSVTNVGFRITFNRGGEIVPETHVLNFNGIWKKLKTEVIVLRKIRDEKKFANVEELKTQISRDVSIALRFFKFEI